MAIMKKTGVALTALAAAVFLAGCAGTDTGTCGTCCTKACPTPSCKGMGGNSCKGNGCDGKQ